MMSRKVLLVRRSFFKGQHSQESLANRIQPWTKSKTGRFLDFFSLCTVFNTASSATPSDSTVSEDAGIEPRTVETSALAVRRSNHQAIDLIHPSHRVDKIAFIRSHLVKITSSRKNDLGCSSRIRIFPRSRIQGSKKHRIPDLDPQHCFWATVPFETRSDTKCLKNKIMKTMDVFAIYIILLE